METPPAVRITDRELQGKFNRNEGGYPSRIDSLDRECVYDRPAHPNSGQPPRTRSNLYKYFDGKIAVMYLHCFVLRSGKLGASGKMDPKRLLVDGIYYCCD